MLGRFGEPTRAQRAHIGPVLVDPGRAFALGAFFSRVILFGRAVTILRPDGTLNFMAEHDLTGMFVFDMKLDPLSF
ncbi:hypothetical protein AB0G15_05160 [Streptosporangium sp. NPDC023825]|uniref:hypothetical protein n=1 Tax=Streptosporangium sp. NPDC023825 TaxID=3154909 RepID=UPI00341E89BC